MKIIKCKNCGEEKEHAAKGFCDKCYKQVVWRNNKRRCIICGREMPIQAKGMCTTCYSKSFHRDKKEAYQSRKLYGIDYKTYKKKTESCVICGFNKIVDLHHLDKNRENRSESNLVGLCPNHHRMLHKSEHRNKILLLLKDKGFQV